jgi:hypothetical protein
LNRRELAPRARKSVESFVFSRRGGQTSTLLHPKPGYSGLLPFARRSWPAQPKRFSTRSADSRIPCFHGVIPNPRLEVPMPRKGAFHLSPTTAIFLDAAAAGYSPLPPCWPPRRVRSWGGRCPAEIDICLFCPCRRLHRIHPTRRRSPGRGLHWRKFWRAAAWCC